MTRKETGYREIHSFGMNPIDDVAPAACKLIREDLASSEQPFFLNIGAFEVHRPFTQPYVEEPTEAEMAAAVLPPYIPDTPGARRDIVRFQKLVRHSDARVGEILDALRESGLEENTIVYFTTDHGAEFCRAKMTLYDPGTEVACLIRWPRGIPGGRRLSHLASNIDIVPTVLDLAGLPVPDTVQGASAAACLTGEDDTPWRDFIVAEKNWHVIYEPMRALRTDRWKYIWNKHPGFPIQPSDEHAIMLGLDVVDREFSDPKPSEELYDLEADPLERNNLARDPACRETLEQLREMLFAEMDRTGDPIREREIIPDGRAKFPPNSIWHHQGDGTFRLFITDMEHCVRNTQPNAAYGPRPKPGGAKKNG
jgi:arylsulfatase A-like enzyme